MISADPRDVTWSTMITSHNTNKRSFRRGGGDEVHIKQESYGILEKAAPKSNT